MFEYTTKIDGEKHHFRRDTPVGHRYKLLGLVKGSRQVSLEWGDAPDIVVVPVKKRTGVGGRRALEGGRIGGSHC